MVVQGHEGCVDDDTECYEEIHKGVEDDDGEKLSQANVAVATIPHAHHIHALDAELTDPLLQSEICEVAVLFITLFQSSQANWPCRMGRHNWRVGRKLELVEVAKSGMRFTWASPQPSSSSGQRVAWRPAR